MDFQCDLVKSWSKYNTGEQARKYEHEVTILATLPEHDLRILSITEKFLGGGGLPT
jgi:hypothetical protein